MAFRWTTFWGLLGRPSIRAGAFGMPLNKETLLGGLSRPDFRELKDSLPFGHGFIKGGCLIGEGVRPGILHTPVNENPILY